MSRARATCTCATCGRQFEVTAVKHNSREARRFEEWAEANITECKECEQKRIAAQRAEENARAAAAAGERGWPVLEGTEKQVAWANTIRETGMTEIINRIGDMRGSKYFDEEAYRIGTMAVENMMLKTNASWWIDNRDCLQHAFKMLCFRIRENPAEFAISKAEETELNDDKATIAEPEERKHDGVVDIRASEQRVTAAYRKDDDFRELVKSLGYSWMASAGVWGMTIGLRTGTASERAAELGNKLLNAGFAIRIQDAETLRNAIEGNYEPMTHRWIAKLDEDFFITWAYDDSFYDQARRLPGAKYKKPGMLIPACEYDAILDFARAYGFRMTTGAQKLVNEMQSKSTVVTPAAPKTAEYEEHPVCDILNSSREIIDDLKEG